MKIPKSNSQVCCKKATITREGTLIMNAYINGPLRTEQNRIKSQNTYQ